MRPRLGRWAPLVSKIAEAERAIESLADQKMRKQSLSLRYRAKSGEPLERLLPEAFALVCGAARRTIDLRHYDVQFLGGIAMFHGSIAEMETGEGKTLTATLPLYLRALAGKGAHLATVNDYLANRDAQWMGPIYDLLGMTVGVVQTEMSPPDRRKAYACDITYGTAKEFGFDFLRDRLLSRRTREQSTAAGGGPGGAAGEPVQREAYFALVDEADSVLIDEARTPLIIGALTGETHQSAVACYQWSAAAADQFVEDEDYEYDNKKRKVELTLEGRQLVRSLPHDELMNSVGLVDMYEYTERAIKVHRDFHLDCDYVVRDDEVVIVDEFTGRLAEGRRWQAGIHQAIEAKEGVEVTVDTGQAARVTVQDYFLRYRRLAGMTGTAMVSARELHKIYGLRVVSIPTNRPLHRQKLRQSVYPTSAEKWSAIVEEVIRLHATGRPVLIGTRSIDKSEMLSRQLTAARIEHQVLNARHIAQEAEIVAQAGQSGKVTVSTNMAGRGTDIKLGPEVAEAGGLHVICTELHDSARIDRQLMGRCGRQGDPGTYRQYLALDDDILRTGLGPDKADRLRSTGASSGGNLAGYGGSFRKAQRRVEGRHFRSRRALLHYEKQRKKMQREMGQDHHLDTPD